MGTNLDQGKINFNDATSWTANTALTLNAGKDINFNNEMTLSGDKAKLAMNYDAVNGHDYNLGEGAKINITGSLPTLLINGTAYTVINELGEEGDASVTTLQGMKNNLTGNYALGSDIDASNTVNWNDGKGFNPVGEVLVLDESGNKIFINPKSFTGQFHGLGHVINDLHINQGAPEKYVEIDGVIYDLEALGATVYKTTGLFGLTTNTIRNVGLVNGSVKGYTYVGSLVGLQNGGTVSDSFSSATVSGHSVIGGLVGSSMGIPDDNGDAIHIGQIVNSHADGNVSGNIMVGGLLGGGIDIKNSYSTSNISINTEIPYNDVRAFFGGLVGLGAAMNSHAIGNINVPDGQFIGGLIGLIVEDNDKGIYTQNSYATGNVIGARAVGGLAGGSLADVPNLNSMLIKNSYATGSVTGTQAVGGLVGSLNGSHVIENTYSIGSVTGNAYVGGLIGYRDTPAIVNNSYWNTETSGQLTSAGGIGKTTAELQQINTFNGWDIANISDPNSNSIWVIDENNDTPRLRQNP